MYILYNNHNHLCKQPLPPPHLQKKRKKTFENLERTNRWWMMTDIITLSTRLSWRKKLKLHQWGCCVPSVWLQHTRGLLLCLLTIYQISTTSWACYEQDLSLYIYLFLLCFFSFGEFVFWLKAPSQPHGKKNNNNKFKEKESIRMQYEHAKLFLSITIDKPKWIENNPKGLALAFFCHYELWCHIAFSRNERPIPPHFPLLRIYFSLRSTSVGHHPQELKIAKRYSKLNRKEYAF